MIGHRSGISLLAAVLGYDAPLLSAMDRDTEIGGRDARFPATRLSVVESLRSDDDGERSRASEHFVSLYWKRHDLFGIVQNDSNAT